MHKTLQAMIVLMITQDITKNDSANEITRHDSANDITRLHKE